MIHPFTEATIAAAQREIKKCRQAMLRDDLPEALEHAKRAQDFLDEAVLLEGQLDDKKGAA